MTHRQLLAQVWAPRRWKAINTSVSMSAICARDRGRPGAAAPPPHRDRRRLPLPALTPCSLNHSRPETHAHHAHRRLHQAGPRQRPDSGAPGHQHHHASGGAAIVNPYDLFAIEAALRLKDELGGRVTVMSMGPTRPNPPCARPSPWAATRPSWSPTASLPALTPWPRPMSWPRPSAPWTRNCRSAWYSPASRPSTAIPPRSGRVSPSVWHAVADLCLAHRRGRPGAAAHRRRAPRRGGVQVLETAMPALITLLEGSNEIRFATTPGMFRAARRASAIGIATQPASRTSSWSD